MISFRDYWPWTKPSYITMTQRLSNNHWNDGTAIHPSRKKFRVQKSAWKFVASIFWYQDGIFLIDYLPKGQTINTEVFLISVDAIEGYFEWEWGGKVIKLILFLHDNAASHRILAIQKKLAYLAFHCFDHPPCSPYLALSDYHVFPGLKIRMKNRYFSSDVEVIVAAETWMDGRYSEFCWVSFTR